MIEPNKPRDYTLTFQQMASFVAIAKTRNSTEVLDELVLQCFVLLPDDNFHEPTEVLKAIGTLFPFSLSQKDVTLSVKRLREQKRLVADAQERLKLSSVAEQELSDRLGGAKSLEEEVKRTWLSQVIEKYPFVSTEKIWMAMRMYLGRAFRRHGIYAVSLLQPHADVPKEDQERLSTILDSIVVENFEPHERQIARESISSFMRTVQSDPKRADYITQLADGAFNYFCLAIAPEVSQKLRGELSQLIIFLDTNFLFGILGLHTNSQVDVSTELLDAINKFHLPFRLRYHEATQREMSNTLFHFGDGLRRHRWPQQLSRAALKAGILSGLELRYHQRNSEQPIEVDDFFAPYKHWEVLLKDRGIDIYRVDASQERLLARADLEAEYKDYLRRRGREKPDAAIEHDVAVLETVHSLRSRAKSTLDAGAVLATCDYHLYRFDWEANHQKGISASAVLPSLLWQVLRPFVAESDHFDRAFAETFALPEFTLVRGGAERAANRMLSILASYKDIPEETAVKMLANDLLLTELEKKKSEQEFVEAVELALVTENASLLEEKAALEIQLSAERASSKVTDQKLAAMAESLRVKEQELSQRDKSLQQKDEAIRSLQLETEERNKAIREASALATSEKSGRQAAEGEKSRAEIAALQTSKRAGLAVSVLVVIVFELAINSIMTWPWLLNHSNSYGLQGCISFMLFFGMLGLWVKPWRKALWLVGVFGVLFVALQLLGGPHKTP